MATRAEQVENWWAPVLRGIVAILFGLAVLTWPEFALFTLRLLIVLFGLYALVDGILAIISTIRAIQGGTSWWSHLIEGVVGIVVGLLVLFWPGITSMVLLYFIAGWAIITGIFKMIAALPSTDWPLIASGAVAVIFGLVLLAIRAGGATAFITVIGIFAVIYGFLLLVHGFQMRTQPG